MIVSLEKRGRRKTEKEKRGFQTEFPFPGFWGKIIFRPPACGGNDSLPASQDPCEERIFAFHIHSGTQCSGEEGDPFARALSHYNPDDYAHPHHAGDLPPLFGNRGRAFQAFLTDRFSVREVIGRTVILHAGPDDFASQPSGNAGEKIACGLIEAVKGC